MEAWDSVSKVAKTLRSATFRLQLRKFSPVRIRRTPDLGNSDDERLGPQRNCVLNLFSGGCAAKSGALAAGDELISLNGVDVTSMSRTEAWNMMKRLSDGQVVLNIRQPVKE